ncbi:hypothetical protein SO802_032205 [Lithocarpus litseifolius]|uniref:Uncharacterized protein n=1 Tax=Lithocarpus litseifolius TaxID=425828 RepID=A0AAW2BQP1_9ROSI
MPLCLEKYNLEARKVAQLSYNWKIGMEDRLTSGEIGYPTNKDSGLFPNAPSLQQLVSSGMKFLKPVYMLYGLARMPRSCRIRDKRSHDEDDRAGASEECYNNDDPQPKKTGDFSVRSAYDLLDQEAMSGYPTNKDSVLFSKRTISSVTCEQWNEVPETNQFTCFMVLPARQEGAVIRDYNGNFVAAKVEVIVSQCCLDAHFTGFWHAL